MDILKTSTDWEKAELWPNGFFALFGVMFVVASLLFWSRGETDMTRAFVLPMLVAGVLMLTLGGAGILWYVEDLSGFGSAFAEDAAGFVASEIERAERTMAGVVNLTGRPRRDGRSWSVRCSRPPSRRRRPPFCDSVLRLRNATGTRPDRFERQPIGRPWVTLAIDVATRMVAGYYATLEAPSRLSVALCLAQAVAPKAELLAELACSIPWPTQGKPHYIHIDDALQGLLRAATVATPEERLFNITAGPAAPMSKVARLIERMTANVTVGCKAEADPAPGITHIDNSLAARALGFKVAVPLAKGLKLYRAALSDSEL